MLELLGRPGSEREAHADRGQQPDLFRAAGGGQHRACGRPREERVQQHRPRIPGRDSHRPRSGRRLRLRDLRPCDLGFRDLGFRGSRLRGGRLRRERQRLLQVRPAHLAQHRGLVHPQPPGDLASRIPSARQARACSHDASAVSRGGPAGRIRPAVPSRSDRCRSVAT